MQINYQESPDGSLARIDITFNSEEQKEKFDERFFELVKVMAEEENATVVGPDGAQLSSMEGSSYDSLIDKFIQRNVELVNEILNYKFPN